MMKCLEEDEVFVNLKKMRRYGNEERDSGLMTPGRKLQGSA